MTDFPVRELLPGVRSRSQRFTPATPSGQTSHVAGRHTSTSLTLSLDARRGDRHYPDGSGARGSVVSDEVGAHEGRAEVAGHNHQLESGTARVEAAQIARSFALIDQPLGAGGKHTADQPANPGRNEKTSGHVRQFSLSSNEEDGSAENQHNRGVDEGSRDQRYHKEPVLSIAWINR